eukprot:909206_1
MGNFYTLNSMVLLVFTQITSIRSYKTIYAFSCLKSAVSMNTHDRMHQYPHKMAQNTILWMPQHYLKIEKAITLIYKSKIDHEYKKANCITNFILSSYAVLMPSYIHLNAANNKINIEYWYLHLFHEYYLVKNGVLFTKWLLKVMRIFVKTITLLRK